MDGRHEVTDGTLFEHIGIHLGCKGSFKIAFTFEGGHNNDFRFSMFGTHPLKNIKACFNWHFNV